MAALVNGPEGDALDWGSINWPRVEGEVGRLRQRIFTASQAGSLKHPERGERVALRGEVLRIGRVSGVPDEHSGHQAT